MHNEFHPMREEQSPINLDGVAIIGMSGRFPGAANTAQFWENLKNGVESIAQFSAQELEVPDGAAQARQPNYVRARAILNDIDQFEPAFFGIYPQEAIVMDPQHRVFLECCWEALEDAGYDTFAAAPSLGVFAGCSPNSYFLNEVCRNRDYVLDYTASYQVGHYTTMLGTIADTLATRVAYKLNLRGPAVTLLCACSTSLVAACQACTNLLTYQCDVALAGGVSITLPQRRGYLYQPGGMVSPDGHCRAFDKEAQGTVFGSGAGVVLLKRLADAVADRDHIYAVIKGFATNNDGAGKVGFTAPSVEGQANVIATAQTVAGFSPDSITYIEAHGTATPLGDPIEVAALTQVFRESTARERYCALGTAKTNVGHLDVASGVTGLIKTALALKHRQIPPTLHFQEPNPKLQLETSPFYVNSKLQDWQGDANQTLRAGVSAFGVGGTNAHIVLEEPPRVSASRSRREFQILPLSAKSATALESACDRLADRLQQTSDVTLADASFTLAQGRRTFEHRRAIVCRTPEEAIEQLRKKSTGSKTSSASPRVAFLFPGQGSQFAKMGSALYRTEPRFRSVIDQCAENLAATHGYDLRQVMFAPEVKGSHHLLHETKYSQTALFVTEYALAQLLISWGIKPSAMLGHSVGEFVAGCLAGVFSLEQGLALIAGRAQLMQDAPRGAMLAVRLPEAEVLPLLNGDLSLAAVNARASCVVSGPSSSIARLQQELDAARTASRPLQTSHAFHSSLMEGALDAFGSLVRKTALHAPAIPYVSCCSGTWITEQQATDAGYWTRHLRETVRFSDALQTLLADEDVILLEVGPGTALQGLARQAIAATRTSDSEKVGRLVLSGLPQTADGSMSGALAALWSAGVSVDWNGYFENEALRRVPLPTYPFERSRFWVDKDHNHEPNHRSPEKAETIVTNPEIKKTPETNGMSEVVPARDSSRRQKLATSLAGMLSGLSGVPPSDLDCAASFLELGFDSLFLTQVAQALERQFPVKVTFRQLIDELNSIDELSAYLDQVLPVSDSPAEAVAPPTGTDAGSVEANLPKGELGAAANDGSGPANDATVERIMKQQLQAMNDLIAKQLALLKPGTLNSNSTVPAQTAPVAAPKAIENKPAQAGYKAFGPYKPAQRSGADPLTETQRAYLNALIARYTTKTRGSKELAQKYRRVLADPRVVSGFRQQWKSLVYPIATNRSRGSRLWDIDGNEYIDLLNGFGPISLGHLPDFVREAAHRQLDEGIEIGPQTPLAGEVAELLCEITGMERATFCNTGSEAVMAAMRLARTVTGRNKVVYFTGDYHGNFDEVLVKRVGQAGQLRSAPIAPGIPVESVQNIVVLDYGSLEALAYIRENANQLAAVLVEPMQSRHPALQPREFLAELRTITAGSGTALIFDEIVTGFRVHLGGAQAYYGIRADMATYGKVLGGGFPIGAIAGCSRFMDALDGGQWNFDDDSFPEVGVTFFAGTFVRHPLALAAAKAVLEHLKTQGPQLQANLTARTKDLVTKLNSFFEAYAAPSTVESCGSVFYFSFPPSFKFGSLLYYHLRERGIHLQEGFPCFLTTAHTPEDLSSIASAFEESLAEMSAGGVLPKPSAPALPAAKSEPADAPITEPQLEILVSAKLSSDANCSYNESFTVHLQGEIDRSALHAAIRAVTNRHDILRATFDLETKTIRFAKSAELVIEDIDLSGHRDPNREFEALINSDAQVPFDLETGPLVRIRVVPLASDRCALWITAHHIVCDGWSTNVLVDEISKRYTALSHGRTIELAAPIAFSDYSRFLDAEKGKPAADLVERYWLDQFKTLPPLLDLPLDRPRPAVKSFTGATVRKTIDAETARALKRAGGSRGCTLFVTLLSGFQALLSRLTGQDDLVVGIPAAAQSLVPQQTLVGHCVNFLPLRSQVNAEATFSQLLTQSKKTLLDAYDHQTYTFGTLVRKLNVPRDPSRLPLVEVQFNLERLGKDTQFGNLKVTVDSCAKQFVNFDLFLNVVESPNGLVLDCDYNTSLFDEETVLGWLSAYESLLVSAASNVHQPISRLPLLDARQREHLLFGRNQTAVDYPKDRCVHDLVEEQTALNPCHAAVVFGGDTLTYGELNKRADQLATFLHKHGVAPNRTVAILVERSTDMVVAMLGVLKAGGAYLPLDPAYPKDRLDYILAESEPAVVLTQEKLAHTLTAPRAPIVCLDSEWSMIAQQSSVPTVTSAGKPSAADLAYVIYTSGSTGKPKGVEISHRAVVNFLYSMKHQPGMSAEDRLLAVTTLSFDIAALEIFLPLVTGARVVIATREQTMDGLLLAELIASAHISVMQATPSTWRLLLEAGWKPNSSLKMLCGGEALPRDLADQLMTPGAELWNMYGPTETTIWSAVSRVNEGPAPVRIGPPIANTQFYVLDGHRQPQPLGVPGELYIGGDGIARGYFRKPELTAEKFVTDPFRLSADPEPRTYRTGDLVRALANGELEFLGRLDNQVKIRGFRIELGEIETVLSSYPGISEAVVTVFERAGAKNLVAYYAASAALPSDDLRAFVDTALPAYMAPNTYVFLPALPRTPNGKIDRKALPQPDLTEPQEKRAFRAPRNEYESKLATICSEVLMIDKVGIDDNLFELGADSIQIFRIVARANRAGFALTAPQVLLKPTIAGVACAVSTFSDSPARPRRGPIVPVPRQSRTALAAGRTPEQPA